MIGVSLQNGPPGTPRTSNFVYVSTNAGKTWRTVPAANPGRRVQGDDAVTFGPVGIAYRTYISLEGIRVRRPERAFSGILLSASRDGLTWSEPVAVIDHVNSVAPLEDKPWPKVDGSPDSPYKGNLYVAWTRFDEYGSKDPNHKTHVYCSRSSMGAGLSPCRTGSRSSQATAWTATTRSWGPCPRSAPTATCT